MTWQITLKTGRNRGESWLIGEHPLTIGRSLRCDITIGDPTVSRRHCTLRYDGTHIHLEDLGSRNVTLVNGNVVKNCILTAGDEFSLGTETFIVARTANTQARMPGVSSPNSTTISHDPKDLREDRDDPSGELAKTATTREIVALYRLSQKLYETQLEHEFAAHCLATMEKFFTNATQAVLCFCATDGAIRYYPEEATLSTRGLQILALALRNGQSALSVDRKYPFQSTVQTCIAPLRNRDGVSAALMLIASNHERPLEESDRERLANLADVAALHVSRLLDTRQTAHHDRTRDDDATLHILGRSPAAKRLRDEVRAAAGTRLNCLLLGHSETQRKLVARLIHEQSPAPLGPLVTVDCNLIPGAKLARALVGQERSASTGGRVVEAGFLDQANGGTLVFHAIDALSVENQLLLTGILRRKSFVRQDSTGEVPFHGRVIATTSKELMETVHKDLFRMDLYTLLGRHPICLDEQKHGETHSQSRELSRFEKKPSTNPVRAMAQEALGYLEELPFRRNANILKRMVRKNTPSLEFVKEDSGNEEHVFAKQELEPLEQAERILVTAIVRQCGGDLEKAAKTLGIPLVEVERIAQSSSPPPRR